MDKLSLLFYGWRVNGKKFQLRLPTPEEQEVLVHAKIQLVPPERIQEFDELIAKLHYLKSSRLVGEHLRYVIKYQGP